MNTECSACQPMKRIVKLWKMKWPTQAKMFTITLFKL